MTLPSLPIELRGAGVDTDAIMRDILAAVAKKEQEGAYNDAQVARAERNNLINLRDDKDFLGFYLSALRETALVDINDFEIRERRARFAPLLIRLKKTIWSLLKFYTFRMWSQQNAVNSLLVTGLESLHDQQQARIQQLEERVAALEKIIRER